MSELADLGEISKETLDEYMANQKRKRQAAGPGARPTPPPKAPDAHAAWQQQQQADEAVRRFRGRAEHLDFERTRADQMARNAAGGGGAPSGPVDESRVPKGDHRTASRGMSNEDWKKHWEGSNQNTGVTQASAPPNALENIQANRAHEATGAKAPGPHAASHVKTEQAARAAKFKMPKGTKRGAAAVTGLAGLGALASSASKKNSKYG